MRSGIEKNVLAVAALCALTSQLGAQAQAPAPAGQAPAAAPAPGRGGPPRLAQGGRGPVKVLVITKGHEFEREPFFVMLDQMGTDITWTHVEHPAAQALMDPVHAKDYDVYLYYDLAGPGVRGTLPNGSQGRIYPPPSAELKKNFEALVKSGKGMVFLHHSAAGWAHHWPEYSEVIGGACDWYAPVTVRGIEDPGHGYYGNTKQHLTVVEKNHPVVAGLSNGIDIVDEAYSCAWFEDSVHPLLRTDFKPDNLAQKLNPARQFSNLTAWYKASENSPIVYIQAGHDHKPWEVAEYRQLVSNAIKWTASKEALDWAKANRTKIFK